MVTPTGYTALDLVGFTDKGPYSSLENYVKNDLAHYAGSIWRCKVDDTTGVTPGENANWTVFISEPSNLVEAAIAPIETSPATSPHTQGSQLFYNDTLYKAKTAIAIGDTLTVGTNLEAAPNVTTQLAAKANSADLGTAAAKDSTNAITQNDTDLVESGAVYTAVSAVASRVDTVEENIAPIENGATASQPYAIGEQFIKDDVLYKAKTAIAQGDTFTLNTNYEEVENISVQISSVKGALANEVNARENLQDDLTDIKVTGSTNNTGSIITGGTFFYLNGDLARAKTAIASGATLTLNTNYELVPTGALNKFTQLVTAEVTPESDYYVTNNKFVFYKMGQLVLCKVPVMKFSEAASGSLGKVCDIPAGFTPQMVSTAIFYGTNGQQYYSLTAQVNQGVGTITGYKYGNTAVPVENITGLLVWFTAE